MNIRDAWDAYRVGKQTEQEICDKVDGGRHDHYWLTTVEPPLWFVTELMETLNEG